MKLLRYSLLGLVMFVFSGCISTEYKTIEVPKYIVRPLPELVKYDVNSSFVFKGLIKEGDYIKVPKKQFLDYVGLKAKLETSLEKANKQVDLYNILKNKKYDQGE